MTPEEERVDEPATGAESIEEAINEEALAALDAAEAKEARQRLLREEALAAAEAKRARKKARNKRGAR